MNDDGIHIPLTKGYETIVSPEDAATVSRWRWRADISRHPYIRAVRTTKNGPLYMHRLIMSAPPGVEVDHINGNPLDNRRHNLRLCDRSENLANTHKRPGGTSRFKGVSWCNRDKKWVAHIEVRGRQKNIGGFRSEEEAAAAYNRAATEAWGEFAKVNNLTAEAA